MNNDERSDDLEDLVKRVKERDADAFEELYHLTYKKAYIEAKSFMKSDDKVEDVLQLAYIKINDNIDSLDDASHLYSWMNTIVARVCLDELRKRKQYSFSDLEGDEDLSIDIEDDNRDYKPDENTNFEHDRDVVMGFIEELPDAQRTALTMHIYEGLKISEIADIFEVSENTIKSRINYAKKALKEKVIAYKKLGNTLFTIPFVPYLYNIFTEYEKTITVNTTILKNVTATTSIATTARHGSKIGKSLRTKIIATATSATVAVGVGYYVYNLKTDVDLTSHLEYSISGVDSAGSIEVTSNDLEDIDVDELIKDYEYSSNNTLSNGDVVTISVDYDEDYADEHKLNIENNEIEVTISGLTERYSDKDEISDETIELIHSYALDVLFQEARYHSGDYYIYRDESDYTRDFNLNEETFEVVKTYFVRFKVNAEEKTDCYMVLLRSSYEYESNGYREIRCRYRYLTINDFYKNSISSSDDVEALSSDLEVFDPQYRYPESLAIAAFEEGFNSDQYEIEEVKYYYNEGLAEVLETYYNVQ